MSKVKEKIVLVHGSFHTSDCWKLLIPELQEIGIQPYTVTLVGHENDKESAFSIRLQSYVDQVIHKIQTINQPVVLLGHSMGGIIISMVAEQCPDLIKHLIYLTANVPRQNDRMIFMGKSIREDKESLFLEALKYSFQTLIKGRMSLDFELSKAAFYNEQSNAMQQALAEKIINQPIRPYFGKIKWSDENLGKITKSYIECKRDKALPIGQQKVNQQNMRFENIMTLASDHSPFYLMPEKLAKTIKEIIESN